MRTENSLLGKMVRGTNALGKAVGEVGTVVSAEPRYADRYGNYPIVVEYENGKRKQSMSFWVSVIEE